MHETKSIVLITLLMLLSYTAAQNESSLSSPPPPPPKSNGFSFNPHLRLNPSMAVIIICLISAFFVMGCVSVYIRQCAEHGLLNDLADDDNTGSQRRPRRVVVRGLDPTIIDTFPMFLYSDVKGLKLGKGALECAVCLNEFEGDETLRLLPKCSHVFHPDCIDAWLASHITCPVCRANLIPKPEEIGSCDSLSHHLLSQQSHSVLPQEVSSANDINNLVINIQISSPPAEVINQCQTIDQNLPARPARKTPRINDKFRSHSMGHLLVQPGEDCERFTLRLPEEARSQLMKSELSRAKSCVAFPRALSSRKGYRSNSDDIGRAGSKSNYYERFHREVRSERWGFTVAPPFFSRGNSTRSSKNEVEWEEITVAPRNLFRSVKSPFDRLFGVAEKESNGERSFNRLRAEFSV